MIKPFVQNFSYSEDCLYLDVYTPNVSSRLPVRVYIHAGDYEVGTAITYPSDILALHGVVVVVIQYRLGPFGFLTTGILQLLEIKDNIENFWRKSQQGYHIWCECWWIKCEPPFVVTSVGNLSLKS